MEILGTFMAVLAALEMSKYLNGKRAKIRKIIIRKKRRLKRWINEKIDQLKNK